MSLSALLTSCAAPSGRLSPPMASDKDCALFPNMHNRVDMRNHAAVSAYEAGVSDAVALASAYLLACPSVEAARPPQCCRFIEQDARGYFQLAFRPGKPAGGSCGDLTRVGSPSDGGKMLCDVGRLSARGAACTVVSVGSNGESSFERAVHALAPACALHTLDGTLTGSRAALASALPPYVRFEAVNFGPTTWRAFAGRTVDVLKLDCEGCEYDSLPPWVSRVCTDQIVLELHACPTVRGQPRHALARVNRSHELMSRLSSMYEVFCALTPTPKERANRRGSAADPCNRHVERGAPNAPPRSLAAQTPSLTLSAPTARVSSTR